MKIIDSVKLNSREKSFRSSAKLNPLPKGTFMETLFQILIIEKLKQNDSAPLYTSHNYFYLHFVRVAILKSFPF